MNFRYATPEKFYVEPAGTKVLLVVDRVSQQIYTQGNEILYNSVLHGVFFVMGFV